MPPERAEGPQDAPEPEVVPVPLKPGESVCARCGRVWMPTPRDPRFGIGDVHGFPAAYCTPCVREVEKEVEIALQTEPWEP